LKITIKHPPYLIVLFYIVDFDSCFFWMLPPSSSLVFYFFAFFTYAYKDPDMFCQKNSVGF